MPTPAADRRRDDCKYRGHRLSPTCCRTWAARRRSQSIFVGQRGGASPVESQSTWSRRPGQPVSGSLFATAVTLVRGRQLRCRPGRARSADPNSLKHQSDVNPGFGGPAEARHAVVLHVRPLHPSGDYIGGLFQNRTPATTRWTYEARPGSTRLTTPESRASTCADLAGRRSRSEFLYDQHWRCRAASLADGVAEAANHIDSTRSRSAILARTRRRRRPAAVRGAVRDAGAKRLPTRRPRRSIRSGC